LIKFKSVTARNFMSIGNAPITLDFDTGLIYAYGENLDILDEVTNTPISNGSGKTTMLVDAILFSLFSKTQRKVKKSEIINIQNGSHCEVSLTFEKDDVEYTVERGIKPDKILIYKDGVLESEESKKSKANQIIVEDLLDGISYEVFKNLIILNGTTSKHFFEYGKQEKRVFINEVFRLGFLDYLQTDLTEEIKEKKSNIERIEIQLEAKSKEMQRMESILNSSSSNNYESLSQSITANLEEEKVKLDDLQKQVDDINTNIFGGDYDTYWNKMDIANKKILETNNDIVIQDNNITFINNQIDSLRKEYINTENENICSKCNQMIPKELKESILNNIKNEATKLKSDKKDIDTIKGQKSESIIKMREWNTNANEVIKNYNNYVSMMNHSVKLIEEYKKQLDNASKETNVDNKQIIESQIEELKKEESELKEYLEESREDFNHHKLCRDIIGDKSFYGYYISMFRKYLNKSINEYLEKILSSHTVTFNNDLDADVFDGGLKIAYDNLSTGEKSKINLAILLSFFDVLNSFHRLSTSLMILDEVLDSGVDATGVEMLLELLSEKVQDNPELGLYVVSHHSSNSTFAERSGAKKVVFQKIGGFTTVKEDEE